MVLRPPVSIMEIVVSQTSWFWLVFTKSGDSGLGFSVGSCRNPNSSIDYVITMDWLNYTIYHHSQIAKQNAHLREIFSAKLDLVPQGRKFAFLRVCDVFRHISRAKSFKIWMKVMYAKMLYAKNPYAKILYAKKSPPPSPPHPLPIAFFLVRQHGKY